MQFPTEQPARTFTSPPAAGGGSRDEIRLVPDAPSASSARKNRESRFMNELAAFFDVGQRVLAVRQRRDQIDITTQGGEKIVLQPEMPLLQVDAATRIRHLKTSGKTQPESILYSSAAAGIKICGLSTTAFSKSLLTKPAKWLEV